MLYTGRKRWFLYPPEWRSPLLAVDPEKSLDGLGWYREQYPLLRETKLAPMVRCACHLQCVCFDPDFSFSLQECVTHPGEVFYFPESWHHATLNVMDTIGIAFNHVPPSEELSRLVPPRDYHWRISPLDRLHEKNQEGKMEAIDSVYENPYVEVQNAISRAKGYGSDTDCHLHGFDRDVVSDGSSSSGLGWVSGWFITSPPTTAPNSADTRMPQEGEDSTSSRKPDDISANCIDAVVDLAVVELADYIWCAENTVGVVQLSAVSEAAIKAAANGVPRLKMVVVGPKEKNPANSDNTTQLGQHVAPPSNLGPQSRAAWARAAFVLGLALLGPGPQQDLVLGTSSVMAALDAGCASTQLLLTVALSIPALSMSKLSLGIVAEILLHFCCLSSCINTCSCDCWACLRHSC